MFGFGETAAREGYHVLGFDIEDMNGQFGIPRPAGCHLAIQDVLTLHGAQFKDAALIWASPPCQAYSYMAMPWTIAKAKAAAIRADQTGAALEDLNRLFNACFRIQREASEAAGRHIPLVIKNVRGAIPWVGRSKWNFGSFHLWGDVPALMPTANAHRKQNRQEFRKNGHNVILPQVVHREGEKLPGFRFDGSGGSFQTAAVQRMEGFKTTGMNWSNRELKGQDFTRIAGMQADGVRVASEAGRRTDVGKRARFTSRDCGIEGIKQGGNWWHDPKSVSRTSSSKSPARKAASALIAKIPQPLAQHIARTFKP